MIYIRMIGCFAVFTALCFDVSSAFAQAGSSVRAWASGHGTDAAGCGAPTNPCRSFQYIIDHVVAPQGEIDVLDPAGYGAVTISHAVSIVNDGVGTAGVQQATADGTAIAINAGASDAIVLRGLEINGLGVAQMGVWLTSAGSLTIENCTIQNFTNKGAYFNPGAGTTTVSVVNSKASNNGQEGFIFWPSSTATMIGMVSNSRAENNGNGGYKVINTGLSSTVTIIDSIAFNNQSAGFLSILTGADLIIGGSTATGNNGYGVSLSGGGIGKSYGNNNLQGNASGTVSGSLTSVPTQ